MVSLQISIRRDLYDKLKQLKGSDESFSDVIDRLLKSDTNVAGVLACYGAAGDNNDPEILAAYDEAQIQVRKHFHIRQHPTSSE
jgi:predicted CopG family antitoxin